jgi:acetyl esterase/lipase
MYRPSAILTILGLLLFSILPLHGQQPDRQSPFERLDRNKDGKLTPEEVPNKQIFSRIDTNKDGVITREEDLAYFARRNAVRPAPRLPDTIRLVPDLPYAASDNPRQRLDLLLPRTNPGDPPRPLVVFVHGGGWRNGDKQSGQVRVARFVATGKYIGATIGYRLSNDATWPAQVHDCKAAIRWLRANAEKYGIDKDRIAVMGTSAGGHLVAMLGVSQRVRGLEGTIGPHLDQSSRVTCVVDQYGPTELLTMDDYPGRLTHNDAGSPESLLVGGPIQQNKATSRNASPLTHVSRDDVPILIVHGTDDPLVPFNQSERFLKALVKAGVDAHLIQMTDGGHGGFNSRELDSRVNTFLENHLLSGKTTLSTTPIKVVPRKR